MLLIEVITALLETRRLAGFQTILHKIRAHAKIRGNDLADAAAKLLSGTSTPYHRHKPSEWTLGK